MRDEETESQSESPQPSRIDSLIKRIETNSGDQPVILGSQSYGDLSTQEVDAALEAVDANLKINAIEVKATVSGNGADRIVNGFIAGNVKELDFDILYRVNDPSQARLMRYKGEIEDKVELHNSIEERSTKEILDLFRIRQPLKRKRTEDPEISLPAIPDDVLEVKLKPTITRRKTARFDY